MSDSPGGISDAELAAKKADLTDKWNLIRELVGEATDLAAEINDEEDRRKDLPGTVHRLPLRPPGESGFRPQPSDGAPDPTDQGSL